MEIGAVEMLENWRALINYELKKGKQLKQGAFFYENCDMKLNGNILTITVDIAKDYGKSASGKSIIIVQRKGMFRTG